MQFRLISNADGDFGRRGADWPTLCAKTSMASLRMNAALKRWRSDQALGDSGCLECATSCSIFDFCSSSFGANRWKRENMAEEHKPFTHRHFRPISMRRRSHAFSGKRRVPQPQRSFSNQETPSAMADKRQITDRCLRSLRPAPVGTRIEVWDSFAVPGFGIRVHDIDVLCTTFF